VELDLAPLVLVFGEDFLAVDFVEVALVAEVLRADLIVDLAAANLAEFCLGVASATSSAA
jgi:hypothetical protein